MTRERGVTARRTQVRFLLGRADGPNGVARSVFTTAGYLAPRYDVQVIGLFRRRDRPVYDVPAGVRLSFVEDLRPDRSPAGPVSRRLATMRSRLTASMAPAELERASLRTDLLLLRTLRSMRSGVLFTTRPELHVMAARFAPRKLVLVAQEHMNYGHRPEAMRRAFASRAARIDALVVLTERDREDYLRDDGWLPGKVHCIPNSMPWSITPHDPSAHQVVVGAGRLDDQKGFDRLVEAFAPVARAHPGWELRIYGTGPDRSTLQSLIDARGLGGRARLMGWTDTMGEALEQASVFALSSRFEGLPLVGIEAMSKGLPLVSFDCPRGPRELVRDAVNGFLVTDGDIGAFSTALDRLMTDHDLRRRMGQAAQADAGRFAMPAVGRQWDLLLQDLLRPAGRDVRAD